MSENQMSISASRFQVFWVSVSLANEHCCYVAACKFDH